MKRLFPFVVGAGLCLAVLNLHASERYVDGSTGDDGNMGSKQAPFKTVQRAVDALEPGVRVVIAPGIYREAIAVSGAGAPENPAVIESADPAKPAILSGADAITGWKPLAGSDLAESGHPHAANVVYVDLDWAPTHFFAGTRQQKIARQPDKGWIPAFTADGKTIASEGLTQVTATDLSGSQIFFFLAKGVVQTFADVEAWVEKGQSIVLDEPLFNRDMTFTEADRFYLQNHLSFLDHPGEWVHQPLENGGTRLFWWPESPDQIPLAEAPRRPTVIDLGASANVTLRGLHVRHASPDPNGFGIGTPNTPAEAGTREGLTIEFCSVYQNQRFGVGIKGASKVTIRNSLVADNSYGVSVSRGRNLLVEENQIAWNLNDGLVVAWDMEDIVVRRNAIHHHSRFAHPDNIQTYRGVKNYLFESNVLLAGGQNAHTQQTVDFVARNNIIAGSSANSFFTSMSTPDSKNTGTEKPGEPYILENNTFTLFANGAVILYGAGHQMRRNIFDLRGGKYAYGGKVTPAEVRSEDNLFWSPPGGSTLLATLSGSGRQTFNSLEAFQAVGLEQGSELADPDFPSVPEFVRDLDGKNIAANTESLLFFEQTEGFSVGQHIEYDFDGVDRKITAVTDLSIEIDPPLAQPPVTTVVVSNWGDRRVGPLNVKTKGDRGATIDLEAFLNGDFNADGKRDVPDWPEGITGPRTAPRS